MAPIKHNRGAASSNRDKTKRRRRPNEHANHLLYKCMGDLCGEECDQELQPVTRRRSNDVKRLQQQQNPQDMELDANASDPDDADYVDEREKRRQPTMKGGRVNKAATKKAPTAKQIKDLPVKLGLQKAERYLCSALDFGVQAGYLTPKDAKGRVLRVASGLLQTASVSSVKRINTDAMDARLLERRAPAPTTQLRSTQRRMPPGQRGGEMQDALPSTQEVRDDDAGDVTDSKRHKRSAGKSKRSRSKRHGKKLSGKSRSRSRSKKRHGRKRSMGRSRSQNEGDGDKQTTGTEGSEEQDDLGDNSQETTTTTSSRNEDDGKSVKSAKSSKSAANNNSNDSQASNEDKKHDDNDASNDEASDDDDDDDEVKK